MQLLTRAVWAPSPHHGRRTRLASRPIWHAWVQYFVLNPASSILHTRRPTARGAGVRVVLAPCTPNCAFCAGVISVWRARPHAARSTSEYALPCLWMPHTVVADTRLTTGPAAGGALDAELPRHSVTSALPMREDARISPAYRAAGLQNTEAINAGTLIQHRIGQAAGARPWL